MAMIFRVKFVSIKELDGINEIVKTCKLVVRYFTEDMLLNSVTVRLNEMTERAFLSQLYDYFIDGLRAVFPVPKSHIYVFNIQDDTDVDAQILNVSFSIRNPTIYDRQVFLEPQYVQEKVYLNRQTFAEWARVEILPFDDNLCFREPCRNSQVCMSVLKFGNASGFIYSDTMFFRPIYPVHTFACHCPVGFTGMTESYECDIEVNLCYSNPCGVNGTCLRKEGGYTCVCEPGYTGKNCEISLLESKCRPDICQSDSVCHRTLLDGIHCENCSLGTEYHTKFCQLTARGFSSNTFLTFPSLKQRQRLHLKLSFATRDRNALLLYNGRYNDKHDFISLEIINSSVVFSFSLGVNKTQVSAGIEGGVSDGQWHDVTISYLNRTATISIDDCDTAISIKYGHRLGGYHCANKTVKVMEKRCLSCYKYLDVTGPLQIGGLPNLPLHKFQVSQKSFIGCIKDIYIDHVLLDLNRPVQDNGTEKGCHDKEDFCRSSPCLNGGSCVNGWGSYMCHCSTGFVGKSCEMSIDEARHFHGNGYMSFNPSLRPVTLPWNVSLSFRTRQRNGLLMKMVFSTNNEAVFQIVGGHIHYNYNTFHVELDSIYVDDGKWHNIEIKWMTAGIWASLDYNQYELVKTTPVTIQSQYVNLVSIGGIESTNGTPKYQFFKGCIQLQLRKMLVVDCKLPDPCESNPCPRNSWCLNTWDAYICQCEPGYIGHKCVGVCKLDPCENGAQCQTTISGYRHNYYLTQKNDQWSQNSYTCDCDPLHTGRYCQVSVGQQPCPRNWWGYPVCGPCNCDTVKGYNADCNKTTGQCVCKDSHYQPEGETDICLPCNCYLPGSFGNECNALTGQCFCRKGVFGRRCNLCSNPVAEITVNGCEVVYDRCPTAYSKGIWWKGVGFDTAAYPVMSKWFYSRVCRKEDLWEEADMFNCTSNAFLIFQGQLNQFEAGLLKVNTYLATTLALGLRNAINSTLAVQTSLYGNDVMIISRILHYVLEFEQHQTGLNLSHKQDKDFMRLIVEDASFILDADYKSIWKEIKKRSEYSAEELLVDFEKYSTTLVNTKEDSFTDPFQITTNNLIFGLDTISQAELWSFVGNTSELRKSRYLSTSGTHVKLPKYNNIEMSEKNEATNVRTLIPLHILDISEPTSHIIGKKAAVISYAIYPTIGQLIPNEFSVNVRRRYGIPTAVSSSVFTLTLQAADNNVTLHGEDLSEDVEISFMMDTPANKVAPQCVFWDYFAEESKAQFVVSYLGLLLSLFFLFMALLVLCSLRGLQTNSNTIHKNLIVCIFMVELIFLVALKLRSILSAHEFPCKVIAIMLHNFYIAVFAWMCVEGIHLYRMMTELRDINHGQMRFYYCVGYGIPAIIVGLAVGVRVDQYGNYFFCWLSIYEGAIWSLVGPTCFFIVVTLAIFAMAVSASIQIKDTVTDFGNLRTLLWLGIGLLPLLGATWTLMLLSVNEMNPLLSFFVSGFCLLQAIYIFLGYCILNKKVLKQLKYTWLRMKGEKVPYDASLSGTRTTIASRSALAYNSPFDVVMHRNIGISTSSTTSRSTAKTSSSPYRSDYGESVLRVTNTSTSTSERYGRKKSSSGKRSYGGTYGDTDNGDITSRSNRRRRRGTNGGDSESDSDISVDRASLDLASSHSSDDEEYDNNVNWKKQNQQNFPDVIQSPHKPNNIDNSDYQSISPPYAVPSTDGMNLPVSPPSSSHNRSSPLPLHPPLYSTPQWSVPTQMPVSMSVALQRQQKLNGSNPLSLGSNAGFNWLHNTGAVHNERPTSLNITEGLEEFASRPGGGEGQYSPSMADECDQESPEQLPHPPPEREDSLPPHPASISDDYNYPDYSVSSHTSSPSLRLPSNITQPMSIPPLTTAEISDGSE
ncbi:Protocadherin-like wing polarity protein stan [Nymphon striatum]|nr:Protocadherin-like wing polarity protein stan [Nymphon striatum]